MQPLISEVVSSLAAELRGKPAAWASTAELKRLPAERWEDGALGLPLLPGLPVHVRTEPCSSAACSYKDEPLLVRVAHLDVTRR